jgi:hypothetical protein
MVPVRDADDDPAQTGCREQSQAFGTRELELRAGPCRWSVALRSVVAHLRTVPARARSGDASRDLSVIGPAVTVVGQARGRDHQDGPVGVVKNGV